ncbi:hypothetical protein [Nocardiopsis sp. LOL_012]|uniref:hypothetical protein n=1 Tax=Nocardiopsis sp. LOL_012 TaxID=3345409 RepID=UPI003A8BC37E
MLSAHAHALLSALVNDLPGSRHILTVHTRYAMSTAVEAHKDRIDVEHPRVVERLCDALTEGTLAAVVLRSFTDEVSRVLDNGAEVPVKLVRGWSAAEHRLEPLSEAEMFDAHCTDAASGEPIPPERGVVYTDAPEVDLTAFRDT